MIVKFTHDFQGKITGNGRFFPQGSEADVEDEIGAQLVALQHAVEVPLPAPVKAPEPVKVAPPIKGKRADVEST